MKPFDKLLIFLLLLTGIRLVLLPQMELISDEAYYHLWSEHLDWAYYSKGPGVALAIKAGTLLFGHTELGVRFLSPLFALGTSLLLYLLGKKIFNERVAIWSVLLLNVIPIFNVGSCLMTIDPISIFFWTAAILTFWNALEKSPKFSFWWPLTGLCIGLGFLAKYTNAMQLISVILVLALSQKYRRKSTIIGFVSLLAVFVLCAIPPVIWNAQNDWITLLHLKSRGSLDGSFQIRPKEFFQFLGAHFGVYSPVLFVGMMGALYFGIRQSREQPKSRFLVLFALPLLILYFTLAINDSGEANWTAPAFVSLGVLTVSYWLPRLDASRPLAITGAVGLALAVGMSAVTLNTDIVRRLGFPWPYNRDPSGRLRGWIETSAALEKLRADSAVATGGPLFLIAGKYQTAASLDFYLRDKQLVAPGHPAVYIPESQMILNQFSFLPRYDAFEEMPPGAKPEDEMFTEQHGINRFVGHSALFVTESNDDELPTSIERGFVFTEELGEITVERRGQPVRRLRIYACYDYQTMPL